MRTRSISSGEKHLLRKRIQERRKSLAEKYGAIIGKGDSDLPPEIEFDWLRRIEEYEDKHRTALIVTVRDFVGDPDFQPLESIPPERLKQSIDSVLDHLAAYNVSVDCVAPVEPADLYRFLTEELMNEEMEDVHIQGMHQCFIYEEFHPNHEYDAKDSSERFFIQIFTGRTDDVGGDEWFGPDGERVTVDEFKHIIERAHITHAPFINAQAEATSCTVSKNALFATVSVKLSWTSASCDEGKVTPIHLTGVVHLKRSEFGGFDVIRPVVPGLF